MTKHTCTIIYSKRISIGPPYQHFSRIFGTTPLWPKVLHHSHGLTNSYRQTKWQAGSHVEGSPGHQQAEGYHGSLQASRHCICCKPANYQINNQWGQYKLVLTVMTSSAS